MNERSNITSEGAGAMRCPATMDLASVSDLREALLGAIQNNGFGVVTVDASDVIKIDTANLQVFVAAARDLARDGRALKFIGVSKIFIRIATRLGLDTPLTLVADDAPPTMPGGRKEER